MVHGKYTHPKEGIGPQIRAGTVLHTTLKAGVTMEYTRLCRTGWNVSRFCLGCMTYGSPATGKPLPGRQAWALNEAESQPFLRQGLHLGLNFWDNANVYS